VLRESIRWALANRDEIIAAIAREDRGDKSLSRPELLDQYLELYANDDTAAMADDARRAVSALYERARAAGLLRGDVPIDWSP
jgi:predicted solute-binding protein